MARGSASGGADCRCGGGACPRADAARAGDHAAWGGCALVVGGALRLPLGLVVVGAALSGLPMLLGVAVGIHWIGAPLGLAVFGIWCARLAARRRVAA